MLMIVTSSYGQTIFLQFGPSISKTTWTTSLVNERGVDTKSIIGFNAIAGINYLNFKYFNLCSGLGIIEKGGSETVRTYSLELYHYDTTKATKRLYYFTMNTTCNLRVPIKDLIEPYIFVGPRLDYLFSDSQKGEVHQSQNTEKLNKLSYGLLFGGGINFKLKRILLGLVCNYYYNINKVVNKKDISTNNETYKYYDNTFTVNAYIGYKL